MECLAIPFQRIFPTQGQDLHLFMGRQFFTIQAPGMSWTKNIGEKTSLCSEVGGLFFYTSLQLKFLTSLDSLSTNIGSKYYMLITFRTVTYIILFMTLESSLGDLT